MPKKNVIAITNFKVDKLLSNAFEVYELLLAPRTILRDGNLPKTYSF
jgi:hypothetical protein